MQLMKKAIVIGASSGIGRALALKLAGDGYVVGITGRRKELLESLKLENPSVFISATLDVTDVDTLSEKLMALVEELGGLDLLIISAGTGDLNNQLSFDIENRTIETNIKGFTCIADWGFNFFQQQQTGHLVGISSIGGLRGSGAAPAYNATKAYQINYLEGLRQRANKYRSGITITDVRPGFVDTAMAKGEGKFWVASVEKAARQIYQAIQQKRSVVYITRRWRLIAILLKLIPASVYKRL
jgi:short-subunit dehydrogenase